MEHTPGPWTAHRIGNEGPKGLAFRIESGSGEPKENEVAVTYYKPYWEQADANAKLIAAAPDLLSACEVAVLALTHEPINPDDIEFIKAAIAKAN